MKNSISLLAAAIVLSGASTAFGASSVDLTVKGLITPSACTPSLSNGGMADYGKISAQDLPNANAPNPLPTVISLKLMVECEATTLIAVKSTDNRPGTAYSYIPGNTPHYGLGLATGDVKIGAYMLTPTQASGDGIPRSMIESPDGNSWVDATGTGWQVGWLRSLNGAVGGGASPLAVQNLEVDFNISVTIAPKRTLPLTTEIPLDGSATLEVVYL